MTYRAHYTALAWTDAKTAALYFDRVIPANIPDTYRADPDDPIYYQVLQSLLPDCERGWSTLKNGELLAAAEAQGYQVLVTAIVVLSTTSWPRIKAASELVVAAVDAAAPGTYADVLIP